MLYKDRKRYNKNGYIVIEYPEHSKAFEIGDGIMGIYEHLLVAEEDVLGRPIREGEVVHHLDKNRSNNSPDNLIVLLNPMHSKLHAWLDRNKIIPDAEYFKRKQIGCVRCGICERPIEYGYKYCSESCSKIGNRKVNRPDKDTLKKLLWEKPSTHIAQQFGVSAKAIEKWSDFYGLEKPPRGYWTKVQSEALKVIKEL